MRRGRLTCALFTAVIAAIAASCSDPVHDQQVQALGPEYPGIPPGEYHRAGQPCAVCHGPEGPAQTTFSMAGTVFWNPYLSGSIGANNATVSMVDDLGTTKLVTTNCVGNFWVTQTDFNPSFPVIVSTSLSGAGQTYGAGMFTQISRASSCATCHGDPPNYNALGHVYLTSTPFKSLPPALTTQVVCPVDPNLANTSVGGLH